ncbi:MAG: hypothetical protein HPY55_10670 [Firmicutes bacterium]|nr:hypothetical protein [Bacillota bacterium]
MQAGMYSSTQAGALLGALRSLLPAVAVSVALAFSVNRALSKSVGEARAALAAPFTEEIVKTVPAVLLGSPVVPAHILFGLAESVYDLWRSPRRGGAAALASVLGHAAFGGATAFAWRTAGSLPAGIGAGIALHFLWNLLVTGGMGSAPEGNR